MMNPRHPLLLVLAVLLAAWPVTAPAQDPSDPPAEEQAPETPATPDEPGESGVEPERRVAAGEVVRFGSDYTLAEGEIASDVAVFGGDLEIAGTVDGDVVVIAGTARLGGTAEIDGDLAVIGGPLTVEPGAVVAGDLAVIGGSVDAPPGFAPGGEQVAMNLLGESPALQATLDWLTGGFLLARPIVPTLPWTWGVVLVFAFVYLAINLVCERPVGKCVGILSEKPLTAFLVGVLVLLLFGPVTALLMVSIVGLPVVPLLWLTLLLLALFGKAGAFRWLGARILPEDSQGGRLIAARSLGIGIAAVCLFYMVPVLGFAVWAAVGVFGLGAAVSTVHAGLRREHPALSVQSSERTPGPAPDARHAEVVEAEPAAATTNPTAHPRAGFGRRLGALVLDAMLLLVTAGLLDLEGAPLVLLFLAYPVVLWAWKTSTIGGIICNLRVVRVDGAQLTLSDALVRGLSCIVSAVPAGLGWFWILWDPGKQAWHDRIAGTYVVQVPPNLPLP